MENIEEDSKLDFTKWPKTDPLPQPLTFIFQHKQHKEIYTSDSESESVNNNNNTDEIIHYPCLLCDHVDSDSKPILEHLCYAHQLVIADVNSIANLPSYLEFWKKKMNGKALTEFTTCIRTQSAPDQPVTNYYLLSDILPEDSDLRKKLQTEKLSHILAQQYNERCDPNFTSSCPMCQITFTGDRSGVIHHLFDQHNFNIGLADNLVNINELLTILKDKFVNNQCLYCEKIFKSTSVLRLHMKKKKHNRLNPMNTGYDRFYLLNHLEPGKNWEELKKEDEHDHDLNDVQLNNVDLMKQARQEMGEGTHVISQWDDWTEDSEDGGETEDDAICLFCEAQLDDASQAFAHMRDAHHFDFESLKKQWKLDYYDCIKMLNFIRRQIYMNICCYCGEKSEDVKTHLAKNSHCKVARENPIWKDPQYLFPTYENDTILRNFEDFDDQFENEIYEQEEKDYQSSLMDELIQNRDQILQQISTDL